MSFENNYAEAVVIFDGNEIAREMQFSEFEAVLEGFVPLAEQATQKVHAVYLRVGQGYLVTAAVFFLIDFDKAGFADKRWNVPIEQLADTSAEGPDLGAGPIRLACRSQCAIAWHQQQLWDPQMTPQCNHLQALKKSIQRNALHLSLPQSAPTLVEKVSEQPPAQGGKESEQLDRQAIEAKWRKRTAQTIKEARLKVAATQQQSQQALDDQREQHQRSTKASNDQIEALRQALVQEQDKNANLVELTERQDQKLKGLRDYFEQKLSNLKNVDQVATDTLKGHLQSQLESEVQALTQAYEEKLQMRDVEVMYRDTQLAALGDEIDKLRAEKQSLLEASGDSLLEKIHRSGISFVSFQPGAGHMTIPVSDVASFVDDSDRYTAAKCRVDVAHFKQWRQHYQNPVCAEHSQGCQAVLPRVDRPLDFVVGQSDRCSHHQQDTSPIVQVVS
ncbi:MAG: hypothetical protein ACRBBW_06215 [Cellvibrionaceae bacterium]